MMVTFVAVAGQGPKSGYEALMVFSLELRRRLICISRGKELVLVVR